MSNDTCGAAHLQQRSPSMMCFFNETERLTSCDSADRLLIQMERNDFQSCGGSGNLPKPENIVTRGGCEESSQTRGGTSFDSKLPPSTRREDNAQARRFIVGDPVTEKDVLLGRGGRANNNSGNKAYLQQKETMQQRYLAASKSAKYRISMELVEFVHTRGGRFLKLDRGAGRYYEITRKEARKKASQCLRDVNSEEMRAKKRAKYPSKRNKKRSRVSK